MIFLFPNPSNLFIKSFGFLFIAVTAFFVSEPSQGKPDRIMEHFGQKSEARFIIKMKDIDDQNLWLHSGSLEKQKALVDQLRTQLEPQLLGKEILVTQTFSSIPFLGVIVNRESIDHLISIEQIDKIYPVVREQKVQSVSESNNELFSSSFFVEVEAAWSEGFEGEDYTIAIIDGGFQKSHPMLKGKAVGDACFSSTFGDTTFSQCPSQQSPEIGDGAASNCGLDPGRCDHGTHVASVAVGNDGVNFGIARKSNFMPIDVFSKVVDEDECFPDISPCELTDTLAVLDALNYVNEKSEDYNIVAVNLSLGGGRFTEPCDDDPRKVVIDMLRSKGIATVSSVGNQAFNGAINAPACISSVIAVGATDIFSAVADFSNLSSFIDFMAPGVDVLAADPSGGLTAKSGTSISAPHIAGAFSVIFSAYDKIFPDGIKLSVEKASEAMAASGKPVERKGENIVLPNLRVYPAILDLQNIKLSSLNNLYSSSSTQSKESIIRIFNSSSTAGGFTVSLLNSDQLDVIGTWLGPVVPSGASLQFNFSDIESEASGVTNILESVNEYFKIQIKTEFSGFLQHIVWSPATGDIVNVTSCSEGFVGGGRKLMNLNQPSITGYTSIVRLYNEGSIDYEFDVNIIESSTGVLLATWRSPKIIGGSVYETDINMILSDAIYSQSPDDQVNDPDQDSDEENQTIPSEDESPLQTEKFYDQPDHINLELEGGYPGYVQHLLKRSESGGYGDMTAKCILGG